MSTINYNNRDTFLGETASNSYAMKQKFFKYIEDNVDFEDFINIFEHVIPDSIIYNDPPIGWRQDQEERYMASGATESRQEWYDLDIEYGYYSDEVVELDSEDREPLTILESLPLRNSELNVEAEEFIPQSMIPITEEMSYFQRVMAQHINEGPKQILIDRFHQVGLDNLLQNPNIEPQGLEELDVVDRRYFKYAKPHPIPPLDPLVYNLCRCDKFYKFIQEVHCHECTKNLKRTTISDIFGCNPQGGIDVNHKVNIPALDRVVNGVCDLFSSSKSEFETARTHLTSNSDGDKSIFGIFSSIISYIGGENRLEGVLIMSSILFISKRTKFTMYLFYISLSLYVVKVMMNTSLEPSIETMGMYNLWEKLTECVSQQDKEIVMEDIVPQSIEDTLPLVSTVSIGVLSAMAGLSAKKSLFDTLLNVTRVSETQTKNVGSLIIFLCSHLHKFFVSIKQEHLADYFYIDVLSDRESQKFVERVIAFTSAMETGCPTSEAFHADAYGVLLNEGDSLLKKLDKKSYDYTSVVDSMKKLRNENERVKKLKASLSGTRVEPVGILIKGAPGVAKTILTNRLMKAVSKATLPEVWKEDFEEDPGSFFYALPKDKFFDGYTNKAWATLCDDIYQTRDATNMPDSDALRTISMINIAPYTLPMAKVDAKNNTYFRSPFVFGTTNLTNFANLQSATQPFAVERRWHITIEARVSDKYTDADGKVDKTFLPVIAVLMTENFEDHGTVIPDDFWVLDVTIHLSDSTVLRQGLSIVEVAGMIVFSHHDKIKNFYVNRQSEVMFGASLDASLSRLMNTKNFSDAMYETFNPQAGGYPETWDEFYNRYKHAEKPAREIASSYFDMCARFSSSDTGLPRAGLYAAGMHAIQKHLSALPYEEQALIEATLPHHGPVDRKTLSAFFDHLYYSYERWIARGVSPVTGIPFNISRPSSIERLYTRIKNLFGSLMDFITTHKFMILTGASILAAGVYWCGGFMAETVNIVPQNGSLDQGRMMHHVGKPIVGKMSQSMHMIKVNPQGFSLDPLNLDSLPKLTATNFGIQNNSTDVVAKIFNKYFYILYVVENIKVDGTYKTMRMGHMVNIKGNVFAMPFHFIYLMDDMTKKPGYSGATVVMVTSTKSQTIQKPMEDFMRSFSTTETSADMDICMVTVEGAHKNSIGIMNFLLTDNDIVKLKRYTTFDACVAGSSFTDLYRNELLLRSSKVKGFFSSDTVVKSKWSKEYSHYSMKETVKYSSPFSNGDCGSLLFVENTTFNNRSIMGFHVAGDESNGFSTILTRENMESMLHELDLNKNCHFDAEQPPIEYAPYTSIESQGSMQPVGKLFPKFTPPTVEKSDITKSVLHSKLPKPYNIVKNLPCKLKPFIINGEEIDPGKIALSNYGCQPGCYPEELLEDAISSYESLIGNYSDTALEAKVVLDTREALGSFGHVKPIATATSAGYPMVLDGVENLKASYFKAMYENDTEEVEKIYLRIARAVVDVTLLYLERIRPNWFFKDQLKDEKRKREKVLAGKTRLFSGSPFILLIMFRKYFGAFMDMYFKHNINIGSAIGVNPYSEHWNALARFMLKYADNREDPIAGAGDYTAYDCHEQPEIMYGILDIIQRWYGFKDKDATHIRNCLWAEIVNSKHIFNKEVYEWNSSMPSGNPMTSIINTMYNNIIFRMAYGLSNCDIKKFNNEVYLCCLGDDNIFTVCRENRHKFNEMTLAEPMAILGMIYTTELKEEAVVPFRPISEIEFLKRTFSFNKTYNRWIAPLRVDSIVETLNWSKKGNDRDQDTADNLVSSIREFALHGEETFRHWSLSLRDLKDKYLPEIIPAGEMVLDYRKALRDVLKIDAFSF